MGLAAQRARILESGVAVWAGGKLLPGVSGVLTAEADAGAGTVVLTVGSGSYAFHVLA